MKEVDWTKWSSIAEILSAAAILVTLAYLAVQTRYLAIQTEQNTAAIQATVRQAMLNDDRELLFQQMAYPATYLARFDDSELSDETLIQLAQYLVATIRVRENQWLQYQNGVIDERTWLTYREAIPIVFPTGFERAWWRNRSAAGEFDAGFVEMVNALLEERVERTPRSVRESLGFDWE
jgi:hypothetical protein